MDFLIANAYAQAAAPGGSAAGPSTMANILLLVGMLFFFYFILIRPHNKRMKEHKSLVASLKKGDEVVTNGGFLGRLTEVGDHFVTLELTENVEVKLQRDAIAVVLPKGTMKNTSNN
jgi:preprotein translocase subunit YajC